MSNYTEKNYDISENNYWKGTVEAPNKGYPKIIFMQVHLEIYL